MFHKKAIAVAHFQIIVAPSAHLLIIRRCAHMGPFGRWYLAGKEGGASFTYIRTFILNIWGHSLIFTPKLNMVTLSENSTSECSSTTIESRDHFGSNIVSSTNNNDREFNSASSSANTAAGGSTPASGTPAAPIPTPAAAPGQNPPGLWDLTNSELGYEIASSGRLIQCPNCTLPDFL